MRRGSCALASIGCDFVNWADDRRVPASCNKSHHSEGASHDYCTLRIWWAPPSPVGTTASTAVSAALLSLPEADGHKTSLSRGSVPSSRSTPRQQAAHVRCCLYGNAHQTPLVELPAPQRDRAMVLVLAVGGWLGWLLRGARIQRDAVAALRGRGAGSCTSGSWWKLEPRDLMRVDAADLGAREPVRPLRARHERPATPAVVQMAPGDMTVGSTPSWE